MKKLMLLQVLLLLLIKPSLASDCSIEVDQSKYVVKSGIGDTYEKALNQALIGIDRQTEAAYFVSYNAVLNDSKGNLSVTSNQKFKAAWIDNFVTRSCHDGDKVKVVVLFPKKDVSYFRLPQNFNLKSIKALDKGYGVAIYYWPNQKDSVSVMADNKVCGTMGQDLICAFPVLKWKYYIARTKLGFHQLGPDKDPSHRHGYLEATLVAVDKYTNITELVMLELIRRSNGKEGSGAIRSTAYDEMN